MKSEEKIKSIANITAYKEYPFSFIKINKKTITEKILFKGI